jgi:CDP-diacylglycerol--glycerol-3-phosphate 3-phosphatidyltransferase
VLSRLRAAWGRLIAPLVDALLKAGISPDAVTIGGTLAVVAIALWAFPTGHLLLGAILIGVAVLMDTVDGAMARRSGRTGPWGAFLDSTLDRFADGAIFAGLVIWFTGGGDDRLTALLALACLVLGGIVPYARARAEGVGATAAVGIAERGERLLVSLVATGLYGLGLPLAVLTVALGILAAASLVTVVQRMLVVRKQVREGAR